MIAATLALVLLAVAVLTWRQSTPAAGQPRSLATRLVMLSGAVLAVTAGLCALLGFALLAAFLKAGADTSDLAGRAMLAAMPAGFAILSGLGVWLYRHGQARMQRDKGRS